MSARWATRARQVVEKPPRAIAKRIVEELRLRADLVVAPSRGRRTTIDDVLRATRSTDVAELWDQLRRNPFALRVGAIDPDAYDRVFPGDRERIRTAASAAGARRVDLLGSGPFELGDPIRWDTDIKTGVRWEMPRTKRIDYADLARPSDVKVPWEISRVHWLLPCGQEYLLGGDDSHAALVRNVLDDWIQQNPYCRTVNWTVAMEAALRILSWTWLFHALGGSESWSDPGFRARFLTTLSLHGHFVDRRFEESDINGNHTTADATGLVVAGLFFGGEAERWYERGRAVLERELPRQVFADGVDFEASTAYHRFVFELFLLAALAADAAGDPFPREHLDRLCAMANFTAAYSRPDGTIPLWGDADDARALQFGGQSLNDHRYVVGLAAAALGRDRMRAHGDDRSEIAWWLGLDVAESLHEADVHDSPSSFPDGGVYVLRAPRAHVFVDCGPVGLGGRGGHGHNDALSFEAWLDGEHVISDAGSYVYTASVEWRNTFRSTALHNTPQVDGEEQNRFVREDWLWSLHDDARPAVELWRADERLVVFRGRHVGYVRLADPVVVVRTIVLDRDRLAVRDDFECRGEHAFRIPFLLPPGAQVGATDEGRCTFSAPGGRRFRFTWSPAGEWELDVAAAWVSPAYGVKLEAPQLALERSGPALQLSVGVALEEDADNPAWHLDLLREAGVGD